MSTTEEGNYAELMELLQQRATEFAEGVARLPADNEWVREFDELRHSSAKHQLASLRLSVAIGALSADDALMLLHMCRFSRARPRVDELTDAVIELKELAARPAPPPMSLRVVRDEKGNAVEYIQRPVDADVDGRDFVQKVAELHKRARGTNGTG